jgi:uncharacterized lipoprotein YmbA
VVTEHLSNAFGTDRVTVFPWGKGSSFDYQVAVTVIQFDGEVNGTAVLSARWNLLGDGGNRELLTKKTVINEPTGGEGYDALVTAESRAVAVLSKEIAEVIKMLGKGANP